MTGYIRIVTARILYRSSDDRKGYVEWFYKRVICRLALQNAVVWPQVFLDFRCHKSSCAKKRLIVTAGGKDAGWHSGNLGK